MRIVEEIFHEVSKAVKKQSWDTTTPFGDMVHKYFLARFKDKSNALKSCESTILNFMYSVDSFKAENSHCLLFGQLMAEVFSSNVPVFIGELRTVLEDECGFKLISMLEKKAGLDGVRLPYAKLRGIISKFVTKGGMDTGTESFMDQLRNAYPTLHTEFSLPYSDFLSFSVGLFAKRTNSYSAPGSGFAASNGGGGFSNAQGGSIDFMNNYKSFKAKAVRQGGLAEQSEQLREDCRAKITYFAEKFVDLVTAQIKCNKFSLIDNLQRVLKTLLKRKSLSLLEAVTTKNVEAWFTLLMITDPTSLDHNDFSSCMQMWQELEEASPYDREDMIDEFVKHILQNRKLNEEICKLVIYLTTKSL